MSRKLSSVEHLRLSIFPVIPKINSDYLKQYRDEWQDIILQFLPKKTRVLTTNILKDIYRINDPRLLILIMHLYMENVVNGIIRENLKTPDKILDYRFYQKVQILQTSGIIENKISEDLLILNQLRNKYAHNLYFDAASIDVSKFSDMADVYSLKNYKRKSEKRLLNLFLLKLEMMFLITGISEKHRSVYLMNIN